MTKLKYKNELVSNFFKINGTESNILYLKSSFKEKDQIKDWEENGIEIKENGSVYITIKIKMKYFLNFQNVII